MISRNEIKIKTTTAICKIRFMSTYPKNNITTGHPINTNEKMNIFSMLFRSNFFKIISNNGMFMRTPIIPII